MALARRSVDGAFAFVAQSRFRRRFDDIVVGTCRSQRLHRQSTLPLQVTEFGTVFRRWCNGGNTRAPASNDSLSRNRLSRARPRRPHASPPLNEAADEYPASPGSPRRGRLAHHLCASRRRLASLRRRTSSRRLESRSRLAAEAPGNRQHPRLRDRRCRAALDSGNGNRIPPMFFGSVDRPSRLLKNGRASIQSCLDLHFVRLLPREALGAARHLPSSPRLGSSWTFMRGSAFSVAAGCVLPLPFPSLAAASIVPPSGCGPTPQSTSATQNPLRSSSDTSGSADSLPLSSAPTSASAPAIRPGLGVGQAVVRLVRPLLAVEVDRDVAGLEAVRSPG